MFKPIPITRPAGRIQAVFEKEAKLRKNRPVEEWREKELQAVFEAVNHERAQRGKESISLKEIYIVDTCASGHIDYSRKLAFGCEELINRD